MSDTARLVADLGKSLFAGTAREWTHTLLRSEGRPLSVDRLLHLIDARKLGPEYLRLLRGRSEVSADHQIVPAAYRKSRRPFVSASALKSWLAQDGIAVVDHVELLDDELHELVAAVAQECPGSWVHINAYLAYGAGHGLPAHRDDHDVVVIQCEGSRRWALGETEDVAELEPGDVLAIRRGVHHEATGITHVSLHLTVALVRPRLAHLLAHLVRDAVRERPEENLPLPDPADPDAVHHFLDDAIALCGEWLGSPVSRAALEQSLDLVRDRWMESDRP